MINFFTGNIYSVLNDLSSNIKKMNSNQQATVISAGMHVDLS